VMHRPPYVRHTRGLCHATMGYQSIDAYKEVTL
jgi:hypothetical protein